MNDKFSLETLTQILKKKIGKNISDIDYQITQLHGGTLGDVNLITGIANAAGAGNTQEPFSLVLKKQKKWERPGDPMSWRREYDLYTSVLSKAFFERFRMLECYHAEINDEEM